MTSRALQSFGPAGPQTCHKCNPAQPAAYYPILRVFAKGFRNAPPMPILMSIPICSPCANGASVEDFLGDDGWVSICQILDAQKKAAPDRAKTQLSWWYIADAQAGRFPKG